MVYSVKKHIVSFLLPFVLLLASFVTLRLFTTMSDGDVVFCAVVFTIVSTVAGLTLTSVMGTTGK